MPPSLAAGIANWPRLPKHAAAVAPSIAAFTLPSKAGESVQSVDQLADFSTNVFVSVESESRPVMPSARLFGPPPDDVVVTLHRFLI